MWKDPAPQIHCMGDTCNELLNELGLDVCLSFHVTCSVMPTPADLCLASLAISPTTVYVTHFSLQFSTQMASQKDLPPTPLEHSLSPCFQDRARDPALVDKVRRGRGRHPVSTSVLHMHMLPGLGCPSVSLATVMSPLFTYTFPSSITMEASPARGSGLLFTDLEKQPWLRRFMTSICWPNGHHGGTVIHNLCSVQCCMDGTSCEASLSFQGEAVWF